MHSRFDFDFDMDGFSLEFGHSTANLHYDYEVLSSLPENPYTPKLYGYANIKNTHASIVEYVDGKSLKEQEIIETIDFDSLKDFLIKGHEFFFIHGWVPMDIGPSNIFITNDGFKFIDFSCFHNTEDVGELSEDMVEKIEKVQNSLGELIAHVEKIIGNMKLNLNYIGHFAA